MNKLFFLAFLVSAPFLSFAQATPEENQGPAIDTPVLSTEAPQEERNFNPRKNHWLSTFGFESLKYEVPYEFTGTQKTIKPSEQELWGGRLGFGGALYLGLNLITTTRVEGFYVGTLFARRTNLGPNEGDEDIAFRRKTGNVWGVEASQSLGFLYDFKTKNPVLDEWSYLTVEPFVEAGIGKAWAYNRLSYDYNTDGVNEGFRQRVRDDLMSVKVGGGINFTSSTGYFLYLKAFINRLNVIERKTTTYTRPNGGAATTVDSSSKDVDLDPVTTYAIGGGLRF